MWNRFTAKARKVIFYSQEEVRKQGDARVSTEHVLLGLCREENVALAVLAKLGISPIRVRQELEARLKPSSSTLSPESTLDPRTKRVIDLAHDEAKRLGNDYIGTEHLLLGLVRERDGLAGRTLSKLGIKLKDVRREVQVLQAESVEQGASGP